MATRMGPTIYLHGIGPPGPRKCTMTIWKFDRQCLNILKCLSTPVMCHFFSFTTRAKQNQQQQYFMVNFQSVGEICIIQKPTSVWTKELRWLLFMCKRNYTLVLFQHGEKKSSLTKLIIFNLFISFCRLHILQAFDVAKIGQPNFSLFIALVFTNIISSEEAVSTRSSLSARVNAVWDPLTSRRIRLAQPAWHSVV